MNKINELGKSEGVMIKVIGLFDDRKHNRKVPFDVPGILQGQMAFNMYIDFCLECKVEY